MLRKIFSISKFFSLIFAAILIISTNAQAKSLKLTVKANSKTLLGQIYIYNKATCYYGPLPKIVEKSANHGTVKVVKATFRPKRGPCKGNIIKGYDVYYHTKPGFKGVDKGVLKYTFYPRDEMVFLDE